MTFETFFREATLNPNAHLIIDIICGYRIKEIENPLSRQSTDQSLFPAHRKAAQRCV
ncbi:DUF2200 family protein [Hydrotalea sp.]|uniref:DUF2200 family protein n=1 Tax=Hydrotalea TaxID=1004300 RepID=UPI001C465DA7